MTRSRLGQSITVLAITLLSAGCLFGGQGTVGPSPTPAAQTPASIPNGETTIPDRPAPTGNRTATTKVETPTVPSWEDSVDKPSPDHPVTLENHWNRNVTVQVQVVRESTGTQVHNATYELAAGARRVVYNTEMAEHDGIERFTVVVTARNTTERQSIETNACYGGVTADISDDGTMSMGYLIC